MRSRRVHLAVFLGIAGAIAGVGLFVGCEAGITASVGGAGSSSGDTSSASGDSASVTGSSSSGDTASSTGAFMMTDGGEDANPDVMMNPCGTGCGPVEKCDGINKGLDDNCNGLVDEGCPCSSGQAESCFKYDSSFLGQGECNPGTQQCTENGTWGPCIGGTHPDQNCQVVAVGCHALNATPFSTVSLASGAGNFDDDADPGSGVYTVSCPGGVNPCPMVDAMGNVQVLVSGEYTVTYTKTVNGVTDTCMFPLYVGARGLRVELSWNFPAAPDDVDLDLHMHQPATTTTFNSDGAVQDCGYSNCKISSFFIGPPFTGSTAPNWFPASAPFGDPVDWYKSPTMTENLCYYAPRNAGQDWIDEGKGCHNPRLDIDNITCDPSVTDVNSADYCVPENINVDFPPTDKWIRIGVHYYSDHGYTGQIRPIVKIYCDGALSAELGNHGFYTPEANVTWTDAENDKFWPVADVMFIKDQCSTGCTVKPVYADDQTHQPIFESGQAFGPAYPPHP